MKDNRLRYISGNLRAERHRKGFSQEELAEKSGLSTHSISLIERAVQAPSILTLLDIANALEIDINELLKGI